MPRRSKGKAPDGLKQTTLFDIPSPDMANPGRQTRSKKRILAFTSPSKAPPKAMIETPISSDDDIAGIKLAPSTKMMQRNSMSSEDEDSSPVMKRFFQKRSKRALYESPDESEVGPTTKKQLGKENEEQAADSDESEPPRKRLRLRRQASIEAGSSSECGSSDLAGEVEEDKILDSRLRTRGLSAFQKNLQRMKKRKLGLQNDDSDNNDESDSEGGDLKHFRGSKLTIEVENDNGDTDHDESSSGHSSDFIVEDDTNVELPPEFSMETHQDLSHQFKKIFQFFVHVALQPAKKRPAFMEKHIQHEQYFSVPLQIARRKISGLRDSLVASSVWRPEFKNALQKYPEFELTRLDFAVPSCDACHLGGRLSTLLGRLNGSFYKPDGFEPIVIKKKKEQSGKQFHLGRFCAKRTRVFHEFSHWEYNLFQRILREINQLKTGLTSTGFFHVASIEGRDPPEDLEDADDMCDWLDKRKIIDMEWQTMKLMMESARHLESENKNDIDD